MDHPENALDRRAPPRPPLWEKAVAVLWGTAEATLFFVAPGVWLTYAGLRRGLWSALLLGLYVAGGALLGAVALYFLSTTHPAETRNLLLLVPGVSPEMLADARADLARLDALAVLSGAYGATPSKVYAVEARAAGVALPFFLLATAFGALSRAFLVALVAGFAGWVLRPRFGWKRPLLVALVLWAAFHAAVFLLSPF